MKILVIQPYFSFNDYNSLFIFNKLKKRGHEIEIASHVQGHDGETLALEDGHAKIHAIDSLSISIRDHIVDYPFFSMRSFEHVVREVQPDIIHANNLVFFTTFQSVMLAKRLSIPSVVQVHGVSASRGFFLNEVQRLYLRSFGRSIFRGASKVLCLTEGDSREIQGYGCSSNKIVIIPNGVDSEEFKPSCESEEEGLVLWIGRFVPEKGLLNLLEALKLMSSQGIMTKNVRVMLIGEGPMVPEVRKFVGKLGLEDYVQLRGSIRHSDVPVHMNKASIFVLPSLKEGMPFVLLEAMACGKAVVCSDISGINDVVVNNDNGILVPAKNPRALSDAISSLLNDSELRRKLGVNARRSIVERHDWNIVVNEVEKVYSQVIEDSL